VKGDEKIPPYMVLDSLISLLKAYLFLLTRTSALIIFEKIKDIRIMQLRFIGIQKSTVILVGLYCIYSRVFLSVKKKMGLPKYVL